MLSDTLESHSMISLAAKLARNQLDTASNKSAETNSYDTTSNNSAETNTASNNSAETNSNDTTSKNSEDTNNSSDASPINTIASTLSTHHADDESVGRGRSELDELTGFSSRINRSGIPKRLYAIHAKPFQVPRPVLADSRESRLQLVRRVEQQALITASKTDLEIWGMSYYSARDELFLVDYGNRVVRAMHLRDNTGGLRDVYKRAASNTLQNAYNVCHMSDSDTLLVYSYEKWADNKCACWLVALSRYGSEWREADRVYIDAEKWSSCCALSGSRALVGLYDSTSMRLYRVDSGQRIVFLNEIRAPEVFLDFSATSACGNDTRVAMSFKEDQSVRVYRLLDNRLEELAHIGLQEPHHLMWLSDRLLVTECDTRDSHAVVELKLNGSELDCVGVLISSSERIRVTSWCEVENGFAIFDRQSKALLIFAYMP